MFDDHEICWRDVAWVAFWATFATLDYVADRHEHSLSVVSRRTFKIHTKKGQVAFTLLYATGSALLWAHIVKKTYRKAAWRR